MFSDLNQLIFDKLALKAFCFRGDRQRGESLLIKVYYLFEKSTFRA